MEDALYFCGKCGELLVKDTIKLRALPYDGIEMTCKNCGKVIEVSWPGDWL